MTWGDLLELLEQLHGVTRQQLTLPGTDSEQSPVVGEFLIRRDGDKTFHAPLPRKYFMNGRVGLWVIESICNRLGVPMHFPGWPLIM